LVRINWELNIMAEAYLHGFIPEEQQRLLDQANFLESKIYPRIDFTGCKNLLEIGSGVGAQTQMLLKLWPELRITCVDYSEAQIEQAKKNLAFAGDRVKFFCQDARKLDLGDQFDSVFICWALEHIPDPTKVLELTTQLLLPGAKIWITEVFNSSFYFAPELPNLKLYYERYNQLQRAHGGDPDVGAQLGNMLFKAGYKEIALFHGDFHLDQSKSEDLKKMLSFWKILMKSGSSGLLDAGLINEAEIQAMEEDLNIIATSEKAVFFYQFVQTFATY
jgi:ubiquinone/menaquinone biosynthesis C-methylase UbiE